jgi:uncharacterized repeat protein (TIGR03803 family)
MSGNWRVLGGGLLLWGLVAGGAAFAENDIVLHEFGGANDGAYPTSDVIADKAGNLYGTTQYGGLFSCTGGCGTLYKVATDGTETVLYSFCTDIGCTDGDSPVGGVVADARGNLYGTAELGGGCAGAGCGVVFEYAPSGAYTVLHAFAGGNDGYSPVAGLTLQSGIFYGVTELGGSTGLGTIFSLTLKGKEKVLYTFRGGSDARLPTAALIPDGAGGFYGTSFSGGGTGCGKIGCGTVYQYSKTGGETVLYAFTGGSDGAEPSARLTADSSGNLYGTTYEGGAHQVGVVYKLTEAAGVWTQSVLYTFTGGSDGGGPVSHLLLAGGALYGTTQYGGSSDNCANLDPCGVIFKLAADGVETVLHSFNANGDGAYPQSGLLLRRGYLYGTTYQGGNSWGTVYKLHY